jgi:hypothetical protein
VTAASRRALANRGRACLDCGDEGAEGCGGLNDTVASTASASVGSPTADCLVMIR